MLRRQAGVPTRARGHPQLASPLAREGTRSCVQRPWTVLYHGLSGAAGMPRTRSSCVAGRKTFVLLSRWNDQARS